MARNKLPLTKLKANVEAAMQKALKLAAQRTLEREKQNVGLSDHSLDDLAKLGHPYKQTHFIRIHSPLPGEEHGPVHAQSGNLRSKLTTWKESPETYTIGLRDWTDPDYALAVVRGILPKQSKKTTNNGVETTTNSYGGMVPRNFPFATLTELQDQNIIYDIFETALKEAVKKS